MWEVEKKRLISDGQWGNRSGRSPCDVALTKELHHELLNMTLKEYASMENDAKACYNRMVPNLILLVSRSLGMSKEVCQTVGKTFKRTAHHVMTKAGESKLTFGYERERPIFGSWQGATKSVISWTLVSSILQKIHQKEVGGATFRSKKRVVKQPTIGFVDNNNNCVTKKKGKKIEGSLKESAQKWEKLLYASGGKLELNKCFTYLIKWKHNGEGKQIISEKRENLQIEDSEDGEIVMIEAKQANEAHKTLGFYKSPDMSMKRQLEEMKKKISRIAHLITSYGLSQEISRKAYSAVFKPAVEYALTSSYMKKEELDKAQAKATRSFLKAMGYNLNFPRVVAYKPR